MLLTSRPAQKARPDPWTTTARTPLSSASSTAAERMARNMSMSSELSFSGRPSVTVATPSAARSMETRGAELLEDAKVRVKVRVRSRAGRRSMCVSFARAWWTPLVVGPAEGGAKRGR